MLLAIYIIVFLLWVMYTIFTCIIFTRCGFSFWFGLIPIYGKFKLTASTGDKFTSWFWIGVCIVYIVVIAFDITSLTKLMSSLYYLAQMSIWMAVALHMGYSRVMSAILGATPFIGIPVLAFANP